MHISMISTGANELFVCVIMLYISIMKVSFYCNCLEFKQKRYHIQIGYDIYEIFMLYYQPELFLFLVFLLH